MDVLSLIKSPIIDELEDFKNLFDHSLSSSNPLLTDVIGHLQQRNGKMMRPILVLLIAKLYGKVSTQTLHAAVSLELLHTASLVHDDVVDESAERRGQLSVNAIFNNKVAVLTGDFLLATCLVQASKTKNHGIIDVVSKLGQDLAEGIEFNIASPKQVGEILFDKLKIIQKAKKTKTGQYVTSEDVLESLRHKHQIVEKILEYRGLKKLLNTYIDALPLLINPQTGKVHTSFNQTITATGRLSSSNPNLQNIPIRDENGKEIRKAFIPDDGCLFFSADYSQIELRIMAHLSEDKNMIDAFLSGHDIHAATAAKIYKVDINEVDSNMRRKAKTANFGIIYGISVFGLAERLSIDRKEAKELIDGYFETYPQVKIYMEKSIESAREKGYVETIFNRKRFLPDINSRNAVVRGYAERNAINAPIQGSAADIIKVAMARIYNRFEKEKISAKMILQVHDELNFSVPRKEKEIVQQIVIEEMENAYKMHVPLKADCGWGNNWLEAH